MGCSCIGSGRRPGSFDHAVDVSCIDHRRVPFGGAYLNKVSKSATRWLWSFQRRRWAAGRSGGKSNWSTRPPQQVGSSCLHHCNAFEAELRLYCQSWQVDHSWWFWRCFPRWLCQEDHKARPPFFGKDWRLKIVNRGMVVLTSGLPWSGEGYDSDCLVRDAGFLVAQILCALGRTNPHSSPQRWWLLVTLAGRAARKLAKAPHTTVLNSNWLVGATRWKSCMYLDRMSGSITRNMFGSSRKTGRVICHPEGHVASSGTGFAHELDNPEHSSHILYGLDADVCVAGIGTWRWLCCQSCRLFEVCWERLHPSCWGRTR